VPDIKLPLYYCNYSLLRSWISKISITLLNHHEFHFSLSLSLSLSMSGRRSTKPCCKSKDFRFTNYNFSESQDSSGGTVTWLPVGRPRIRGSIRCKRFIFPSHRLDQFQGPPSLLLNVYWGLFPRGVSRAAEMWIEPLTQSSAKVKNKWSYSSTPPYAFMAWTGTTLLHRSRCSFAWEVVVCHRSRRT